MLMEFDEFVERIRNRLEGRGHTREQVAFHIERLIERYKDSPIFEELEVIDDGDFDNFEDGVKDLPVAIESHEVNLPFIVLKQTHNELVEKRIRQLIDHYSDLQKSTGEVWFPDDEIMPPDPINDPGSFGRTPLIEAAFQGDLDKTNELLDLGADIGAKDNSGNDALQVANLNGHEDVADRLRDEFNKNPLDNLAAKLIPDS